VVYKRGILTDADIMWSFMLKDASDANNTNNGYTAAGKIKRSKAVV